MGDTQSAQRAGKKDAAEEEESEKVNDGQTVQNTEDKPLKNNGQISEINGKADSSIAALNGHCEDKISAEGDVAETEKPLKEEETPLESVEICQNKLPDEADANEVEPVEIIKMEEKQNDINESFRNFFSNIGLKLTVKKDSGEKGETDMPKEGPNIPEEDKDNLQEVKSENEEQNVVLNAAQEANDYDSTTCPTLTDGTSENFLENAETKTTETKEEAESDSADAGTTSPAVSEDAHQDTIPEEEPRPKSPLITDEMVVESPFKRFFTTGIFSSLRKKKKLSEDQAIEKELVDMGENEPAELAEQALEEEQRDKEEIVLDTEAVTTVKGLGEAELLPAVSIQVKDDVKLPSMDTSDSIVNQAEILNSQEKEKVPASPLKKLMSGSSFKNLSKKQKGKKSSDAKISDPQQQISDQLLSSTDSAEYQKEESPTQPSAPAAEDEDGAWAAFKKLVTPKKRVKKSSLSNEQGQISGSVDEAKLSEEQQISDHSTDEGKKRKDSSVSWEAVLCGSGRRRSRKSSDSEEETPKTDAGDSKQDSGLKEGAESPLERSNEVQEIQEGSPSEGDGESTWKSFKKLVTPKTKAKDEDESKDTMTSDDQVTQVDSTFSIKKLLPGRKKRKPAEKPDQVSSDEADKDLASGDEDSETPAVIPLSEFDADEAAVHTQIKTDVESYVPEETDNEHQQESTPPCDSLQIEMQKVQDNEDTLVNEASKTPATFEEPDDLTELISKYQQLSDIPEEGILTETMATPASAIEEAARDDTIAEDLVEITSEAITAPEPVDATVTDETEMISAVSQLSDSSKTSGNITPVPAEYNVKDTEFLLDQVAENISASPYTVTVTSEEPSSKRIVSSVSPQILETFEKEQPKILEIHKGSDETVITTDLNTEPVDAINELAATVQTESVPDIDKAISTEIVSQVPTEESDNAEITVDEVHEVNVTHGQENIKELEATDDSQHVPESVFEQKEELPQETSPEGKEVGPDKGSLVGADQVEEDTSKTETQEAESASFVADENKNGSMEQEAQTLAEKRDQSIQIVTEESQVEDQPSVVVDELEALTNVEKDAIVSEDDIIQSLEKEILSSEDIPPADIDTDESKQREHLSEVTVELENTETQTEALKTDHYEVTDVLEVEQKATVDTKEDSVQLPEEKVTSSEDIPPEVVQATVESSEDSVQEEIQPSEDIQSAEPETDESKQTAEHLTEVTNEIENKEPQVEVPEDVQSATLDPKERSIQSLDKEVISEDIPPAETDQFKEMVPLTEDKVEAVDDSKTEDVQEPAVVQAFTLDSEEDSVQKEIQSSQDIQSAEKVTDESKQIAEHLATVANEIKNKEPQVEVPEDVQAATLDPEERSIQSLDKEVIPPAETDQSKETEMVPLTEDKVEAVDDSKTEDVQEPALIQAFTLDSEGDSVQKEIQSPEDIQSAEPETDESKQTAEHLAAVANEIQNKEPQVEDPEEIDVQAAIFDSEERSIQSFDKEVISEDIPPAETDQPTEIVPLTEDKVEAVDDFKTEDVQEPAVVQAFILDSEGDSVEKEIQSSVDIPPLASIDESKQTTEHLTEVTDEPETKEAQPDVSEVTDVSEVVQVTLESEEDSVQKEIQSSEDIKSAEPETDESKKTAEHLATVANEIENKEPQVEDPEEIDVQAATYDSEERSIQSLDKEVISEDIPPAETDQSKDTEMVPLTEDKVEAVDDSKTEDVQEPAVVQAFTLDSEGDSVQKEIQSSEDIQSAEPETDESKQTAEHLAAVANEIQNKDPQVEDPEEIDAQAAIFDSEERSIQSLDKEVISEDIPPAETDHPTEIVPLTEDKVEAVDDSKTEDVQEPAVVQAFTLNSEGDSVQKEIQSSVDIPPLASIDESKQTTEHLTEVTDEPETKEPHPDVSEVTDVSEVVQATLESEEDSVQEEIQSSEDIKSAEPERDEPKQTTEHLAAVANEIENNEPQVEDPEEIDVQAATYESEKRSIQSLDKTVISEDIPPAETDQSKETEMVPLTEDKVEAVDDSKTEDVQEPALVQAFTLDSEGDSVEKEIQSSVDIPPLASIDESKQTIEHLTEVTDEPETKEPHPDVSEVTDVSKVVKAALESEEDSVQKEIQSSEDIKSAEPETDEPKQTTEHLAAVANEIENKEPQVKGPEEIHIQAATFELEERSIQSFDKEVISEDIPPAETDQPTEMVPVIEDKVEAVDDSKTEDVKEPTMVQAITLDSKEDSVQKEIQSSVDIPPLASIDESKQTTEHLTEVTDEPETQEPQPDVSEVTDVSEVVQVTLESEEDSVQEEIQSSEDIKSAEPETDEPKQTAEHLAAVANEIENKEPQVEDPKEIDVQAATLDPEERSIQSLDKEVISEDIPPAETEQPAEMVPLTEDKVEAVDDSKTEDVQEPTVVQAITLHSEAGSPQVIEEEVIYKDLVAVETVTDEPRQETVELEKVERVKAEISLPDIVPETDDKISKSNVVSQSVEEICTQELETEALLEDVPKPDSDSVTDENEKKVVAQPDQDFEINKDQKTESIPQAVQAEHEDRKAEAVEETVTATHVPSGAETSGDQVLEETRFCEEILAPCVDSAEVSEEPEHEHLSTIQASVEGEKADERQGTETNTAAAEHAVVMQVITCNLKDVSAAIPDVLTEEISEIQEYSTERRANEVKVKDPATPLEKDNVTNIAEEGSVVVMMHVPSVEFDDNHRIQVQVVDVAIKSAENIVDTMIEVGVTEVKEVIDVCHETLEKVETLSASPAFEEEVNNEDNNLTVQEVIQHIKENLPETTPESSDTDLLEQEVMKQADVSEIVQSGSSELEDQKMMDSDGACKEEKDEGHVIPAEQKVSEAQLQRSNLSLDISTHDRKEDLEETNAELQKSEVCVTTEAATASSEELSKKNAENTTEAQRPQSTQSQIATPSNTGLVTPQNTSMISSIGNVESPSSLSLEFKLNIQFGQPKAPASPPPPIEPMKQPDMSTVAVQAVEADEPTNVINAMQRVESEKQIELMEAAVQTTEITEPGAVISYPPKLQDGAVQKIETTQPVEQNEPIFPRNGEAETTEPVKQITEPAEKIDLTERAVMSYQPVLQDIGIQAMETIEPVEQIQSKQSIIPNIQAAETIEPVRQKEKRGVLISHPAVFEPFFEARDKEKKAEESIKQTEEENDDVWLDAEEEIYSQEETGVSRLEVVEPTESKAESEQEEKEDLEPEFEMAPDAKTEDGESQRVHKTGRTCEIESEGEDFAVALEYPETTCSSVPPAEWD